MDDFEYGISLSMKWNLQINVCKIRWLRWNIWFWLNVSYVKTKLIFSWISLNTSFYNGNNIKLLELPADEPRFTMLGWSSSETNILKISRLNFCSRLCLTIVTIIRCIGLHSRYHKLRMISIFRSASF